MSDNEIRYDDHAECALLGAALMAPNETRTSFLAVGLEAWFTPRARTLAGVIAAMLNSGEIVDPSTVLLQAQNRGLVPTKVSPDFIFSCVQAAAQPATAELHAERILNLAACRRIYSATTHTAQRVESSWITGVDRLDTIEHLDYLAREVDEIKCTLTTSIDPPKPLGQFLAEPCAESEWLVPNLLQRMDRIVLTGEEGLGKSELCIQMAVALAAGVHPFSGRPIPNAPQIKVLVIDLENSKAQLNARYGRVAAAIDARRRNFGVPPIDWSADNANLRLANPRPAGIDLLDGRDVAWVETQIASFTPDVLVMGPLYKMHHTNPNDEQPARQLTWTLDGLRERYGFALITEAHAGKATTTTGGRSMAPIGSSVWLRWPEYGFGMRRSDQDPGHRHVEIADIVAWRGARSDGLWPKRFQRSHLVPWMPFDEDYDRQAAA
ncbi:AAA family ATPase [Nocardia africana]